MNKYRWGGGGTQIKGSLAGEHEGKGSKNVGRVNGAVRRMQRGKSTERTAGKFLKGFPLHNLA